MEADPFAVVTVTTTVAATCHGVTKVIVVDVFPLGVTATVSSVSDAPLRFEPLIVTLCPPDIGPLLGTIKSIVGPVASVMTIRRCWLGSKQDADD